MCDNLHTVNVCFDFINQFCSANAITMDATITIKASVKLKMAASSPSGCSELTDQLHDCLFYPGSVMRLRMCRKE